MKLKDVRQAVDKNGKVYITCVCESGKGKEFKVNLFEHDLVYAVKSAIRWQTQIKEKNK